MAVITRPTLIQQFMVFVEDLTPIKPVRGVSPDTMGNYLRGMVWGGLFGLTQKQVAVLIGVGLLYALLLAR
jgi:hypothetical protein